MNGKQVSVAPVGGCWIAAALSDRKIRLFFTRRTVLVKGL
jgi:hypothetical protein